MDKMLVLAGNYQQYRNWRREQQLPAPNLVAEYVNQPEQLRGYAKAKIIRTGEWWLNPAHNNPRVRMLEKAWQADHPHLDCGRPSSMLLFPADLGAEPYCPQCVIQEQARLIGDFASRLKALGTIVENGQATHAVAMSEVQDLLDRLKARFGVGDRS